MKACWMAESDLIRWRLRLLKGVCLELRVILNVYGNQFIQTFQYAKKFYPIALASDKEIYEADVGRGVKIVLYGMPFYRRLPIETEYGALLVKNGVPLGYGVGSFLLDQMHIAVNVFPTFRQGESSFVFEQFARIFHR